MARHIVARTTEIPPGGNKVVAVEGRDIVVFHVNGEFFALLNRCPHAGAPLDKAACVARLTSPEPGVYQRSRVGELLRCAWHGWEFDMRNGQSWFDPKRVKIRTYPVVIEDGSHAGYIFRLTVSIGVAATDTPAGPFSELVATADAALRQAKAAGGNRVGVLTGAAGRAGTRLS